MSDIELKTLLAFINRELKPQQFKDYCPNGLQFEGQPRVKRLGLGVTASLGVLKQAVAWQADALLVHHGYFWKGENPCIVGVKRERLGVLYSANMSLLAYHLPLDVHEKWGNNTQLAHHLGWQLEETHRVDGTQGLLCMGRLTTPENVHNYAEYLNERLCHMPLVVGPDHQEALQIDKIAWCTGGAQRYFEMAIELGASAYFTGEISENTVHLARESGVHFFACGHHATEKYGVQALGDEIRERFGLEVAFFDEDNPV